MPLTFEQAKALTFGTVLHSTKDHNSDGTPVRWRVNGKVQTWKRNPNRIRVPLKHGIWNYDFITELDFTDGVCDLLTLPKEV